MRRRKRKFGLKDVLVAAVRQENDRLTNPLEKVQFGLWCLQQHNWGLVRGYITDVLSQDGADADKATIESLAADAANDVDALFDLDKFERFLEILIKYLPQLIEIFAGLFPAAVDASLPAAAVDPASTN